MFCKFTRFFVWWKWRVISVLKRLKIELTGVISKGWIHLRGWHWHCESENLNVGKFLIILQQLPFVSQCLSDLVFLGCCDGCYWARSQPNSALLVTDRLSIDSVGGLSRPIFGTSCTLKCWAPKPVGFPVYPEVLWKSSGESRSSRILWPQSVQTT